MKMVQISQKGSFNKNGLAIILIAISLLVIAITVIPTLMGKGADNDTGVTPSTVMDGEVGNRITGGDRILDPGGFEKSDPESEALVAQEIEGLDGTIRVGGSVEVGVAVTDTGDVKYSWGSDNPEIEFSDPESARPTVTFKGVESGDTVLVNVMVYLSSGSPVYRKKEVTVAARQVVRPQQPKDDTADSGDSSGSDDSAGSADSGGSDDTGGSDDGSGKEGGGEKPNL